MSTNPCKGCGCCCSYIVEVNPNDDDADRNVPPEMIEPALRNLCDEFLQMKRHDDGYCKAFDRDKRLCTIYDKRPQVCRDFEIGYPMCLEAVTKRADNKSEKRIKSKIRNHLRENFLGIDLKIFNL